MKASVKWQKFYKWYCIVSCLLVVVVLLLTAIGGDGWDIRIKTVYNAALSLSCVLAITGFVGLDLLLWIISVIVWRCRKESTQGGALLGYGTLMVVMKFVNFVVLAFLNGA